MENSIRLCSARITLTLLLISAAKASAAELFLQVRNEKNQPIWCRVEVRGPNGKMYQAKGALLSGETKARGGLHWYLGSFLMNGKSAIDLPAGSYTVVVEHGLEYNRFERQVTVTDATPLQMNIQMRPWVRMEKMGWWSADMHVHRSLEDGPAIAAAEDLNILQLTNRSKRQFFESGWPSTDLEEVTPDCWITERNVEDERLGGSWILHGLNALLTLGREGGWFPPGIDYVRQALRQRASGSYLPWFDIDMPIWWQVPVMVALQAPDSLDIVNNQFMQYGIDAGAYWGKPIDRTAYPGAMGFVNYTLDLYYKYLNLGYSIAPSAGTGTGVMPSPAGYDRIYAQINGPFSLEKWYAAVKRGDSFVTNGPILFFHAKHEGERIHVSVKAMAREPIARVEVIANGKVIEQWRPARNTKGFQAQANLEDRGYTWIAARCFLDTPYTVRLAHSSPVYLGGHWNATGDAAYFVNWINQLIAYSRSQIGIRGFTREQADQLIAMYEKAKAIYEGEIEHD